MKKLTPSECGKIGYQKSKKFFEDKWATFRQKYSDNPKLCQHCNMAISYTHRANKFCSHSCSAKVSNAKKQKKIKICPSCNIEHRSKKYCSLKCQQGFKWKKTKTKIEQEGGVENIRQARRYLLEKSNACVMCKHSMWNGEQILLICDHINGNSDDWTLTNLRMICSNCDATTPFYKNKNMGNGRAYRRLRYRQGKSF